MRYHDKTLTLLGLSDSPVNKALQLPPSVLEWYSRSDAVSLLRKYSLNHDLPLAPNQFEVVSDDKLNFIVFLYENQGIYRWAYAADGSEDPPVYVNFDFPPNKWMLHAETFSIFIYTRVFDFGPRHDRQLMVSGSGDPVSKDMLQRLANRYKEEPRTYGWYGRTQYRFSHFDRRIIIWDTPLEAEWHFFVDTPEAVRELYDEFSQNLLWDSRLSKFLDKVTTDNQAKEQAVIEEDAQANIINLLIIAHSAAIDKLSQLLSTETNINILGTVTNTTEGVQLALDLQPDIVIVDYYLPKNSSEYLRLPSGKLILQLETIPFSYADAEQILKPWRENTIAACEKISQLVPASSVIILPAFSFMADDIRRLGRIGIIKDFLAKPLLKEDVLDTIWRVYGSF